MENAENHPLRKPAAAEAERRQLRAEKVFEAARKAEALREEIAAAWPTTKDFMLSEVGLCNQILAFHGFPECFVFSEHLVREDIHVASGDLVLAHPAKGNLARIAFSICAEFGDLTLLHYDREQPTFRAKALYYTVMDMTVEHVQELLLMLFLTIVPEEAREETHAEKRAKKLRRR